MSNHLPSDHRWDIADLDPRGIQAAAEIADRRATQAAEYVKRTQRRKHLMVVGLVVVLSIGVALLGGNL